MIKFFTTSLLFLSFIYSSAFSQKAFRVNAKVKSAHQLTKPSSSYRAEVAGCDTINLPIPANWNVTLYYSQLSSGQINGFITGNNAYGDQEKAAYFDVSSSANTYLTKVWIGFGVANSNTSANLSKVIPVNIYDGTSGTPGTLLTTVNKTLGAFKADVDKDNYSEIIFPTAVKLPASKKFFVSVDVSGLVFTSSVKDSLAIYSSDADEVTQGQNGFGMEKYQNEWETFADGWGADFGLLIHPFVSTNPTCALTSLPVTVTNFRGDRNGAANMLSWSAETEQNNKGFEIQRSADGDNFSSLAFVPSKAANGNSTTLLSYQFFDEKPLDGNIYYRLKQVDIDGKATLSSVVLIKGINSGKLMMSGIYPNPVNANLNIVLDAPAIQKVMVIITDLAGKTVMQHDASVIVGNNNLSLNVGMLSSGSYIIKAVCSNGCETSVGKFMKQ